MNLKTILVTSSHDPHEKIQGKSLQVNTILSIHRKEHRELETYGYMFHIFGFKVKNS